MMKVKVTNISVNEGATICINFLKCHSVSFSQDQNILGSAEGKLNI